MPENGMSTTSKLFLLIFEGSHLLEVSNGSFLDGVELTFQDLHLGFLFGRKFLLLLEAGYKFFVFLFFVVRSGSSAVGFFLQSQQGSK